MIWLIGTGLMGIEYAKVLKALNVDFKAIGRSKKSVVEFEEKTGHHAILGGLTLYLKNKPPKPEAVIVAVGIEALTNVCLELLEYGVKTILQEKPGVGWITEITDLVKVSQDCKAKVLLAYNRRFYSSILKAEEIIKDDGGISSFNFEFTEWSHTIENLVKTKVEHNTWLMGNSSHVIDTAFFLGGIPKELSSFRAGENQLSWHPSGAIYVGAGVSDKGALFSYQANWVAPGRWSIEFLTRRHRLYFKPMESLQIQEIGSVAINPVEINNKLDIDFKPGLYLQTKSFLEGNFLRFCTIEEQKEHIDKFYKAISGYTR